MNKKLRLFTPDLSVQYCEYFHREQGYDEKDPMRRVGADEEVFRGGKHDEEGLVPNEECFPTRKTDEKA